MNLEKVKKILVFRLSSLGDILLTTPLLRSIKKMYPNISIDFILREEYEDLLLQNPNVNKLYKYAESKLEKQVLFNSIIAQNYEMVIDLQNNFRSRELTRILKCPIFKLKKRHLDKFLFVYFKINKLKDAPPIPVRYANAFDMFELDNYGLDFRTDNQPNEKLQTGEKFIGLSPGARHYTKRWPKGYYTELGKLLEADKYKVVLLGGKDDQYLCDEIAKELSNPINLCNENDAMQTAANMMMCKVVYCNDSGLMHLATAINVPVIAFFGSTVREFGFFPYKSKSLVMESDRLQCRPCTHIGKKSCPQKHFSCMLEITPEDAFKSLNLVLEQT
jgi:heptosyltransferase-2